MTALVVKFKAQAVGEGGGVVARRKERESTMKNNDDEAQSQLDEDDHANEDDGDDDGEPLPLSSDDGEAGDSDLSPSPIML